MKLLSNTVVVQRKLDINQSSMGIYEKPLSNKVCKCRHCTLTIIFEFEILEGYVITNQHSTGCQPNNLLLS